MDDKLGYSKIRSHISQITKDKSRYLTLVKELDNQNEFTNEKLSEEVETLSEILLNENCNYLDHFNKLLYEKIKNEHKYFCRYSDGSDINLNYSGFAKHHNWSQYFLDGKPYGANWSYYNDGSPQSFKLLENSSKTILKLWNKEGHLEYNKTEYGSETYYTNGNIRTEDKNGIYSWFDKSGNKISREESVSYTHLTLPTTPYV